MQVLAVLVLVREALMLVHVAVRAGGHRVVVMRVVTVVVRVNVLVAGRLVTVAVLVPFRGMQPHAGDHQRRRPGGCNAAATAPPERARQPTRRTVLPRTPTRSAPRRQRLGARVTKVRS